MEYKFFLGVVLALLVGIGIGYLVSGSHQNVVTTHQNVVITTQPEFVMNLFNMDGFPVCVYYFPQNSPNMSQGGSWTVFDNSQNRVPYISGNLNVLDLSADHACLQFQ
ncbi:MAG: hypothetical protein QXJ30_08170 [Metallosphaera sp.]|uniref:hypothetical protein n=1 Tax=Metallosphaera sp. TaxID=2020860 RepID=UPI003172CFF1